MSEMSAFWRSTARMLRSEALAAPPSISRNNLLDFAKDCERCADELEKREASATEKTSATHAPCR